MNEQEVSDLYSSNAENYAVKFFQPWKLNTEGYSIFKHILGHSDFISTSFEGKNILDLGCGGGNYVRQFLKLGANRAVGVDLSPGFIHLANQITAADHFDSSRYAFYQADCFKYSEVIQSLSNEPLKQFDIVISVWVICYASNPEELNNIVEIASHFTKPGGTFICMIPSPESFFNPDEDFSYTIQYGAAFKRCIEGTSIPRRKVAFLDLSTGKSLFEVYNYLHSTQELIHAFNRYLFVETEHSYLEVDPQHLEEIDPSFVENIQTPSKSYGICFKGTKIILP